MGRSLLIYPRERERGDVRDDSSSGCVCVCVRARVLKRVRVSANPDSIPSLSIFIVCFKLLGPRFSFIEQGLKTFENSLVL